MNSILIVIKENLIIVGKQNVLVFLIVLIVILEDFVMFIIDGVLLLFVGFLYRKFELNRILLS